MDEETKKILGLLLLVVAAVFLYVSFNQPQQSQCPEGQLWAQAAGCVDKDAFCKLTKGDAFIWDAQSGGCVQAICSRRGEACGWINSATRRCCPLDQSTGKTLTCQGLVSEVNGVCDVPVQGGQTTVVGEGASCGGYLVCGSGLSCEWRNFRTVCVRIGGVSSPVPQGGCGALRGSRCTTPLGNAGVYTEYLNQAGQTLCTCIVLGGQQGVACIGAGQPCQPIINENCCLGSCGLGSGWDLVRGFYCR